ncbi:hypothetical protein N9B94_01145 [Verrucomicrobia bacterium]|nr:hypothetical protein [Verrucomicrobiota bacterium]
MSQDCCKKTGIGMYTIAFIGSFLVVMGLVYGMLSAARPQEIGIARSEERAKNLVEVRQAEADVMDSYGWVDQNKGLVRLPIDKAMELTIQEWQDPAKGRAALLGRVKTAAAPVSFE